MTPDVAEIEIQSIAAGGDGVGRTGEMVVFVPRTAPGDRARVRIQPGRRFGRGEVEEVLRASPARVEPPCEHYRIDRCGGCQLQHLSYDAQLAAKAGIVRDALQRIGKRPVETPRVSPSDREWRYRVKLTLAMRRRDGRWTIGLHPYDDPAAVFQLRDCPITDESVVTVWRELMAASDHFPESDELRAAVRLHEHGAVLVMEGGTRWPAWEELFAAVPSAAALWWIPDGGARRLLVERADAPAGASFGQINTGVAAQLRAHVLERCAAHAPQSVVDAYAGTGDTAAPLAGAGARVTAIELDRDAAARCAARLPHGSRVLNGRVEDLLQRAMPADVVLVNPPRAGMHVRAAQTLQAAEPAPRAIIYTSCDPATLARDLTRLPRYRIGSLVGFDMFPQTSHVETVCELVPEAS